MRIPKNGFEDIYNTFSWNGRWYGMVYRYGKKRYLKSCNVRFDNTCGGTEEITLDEFISVAKKYAEVFK